MKRIEGESSRQKAYSKRKDRIVRKAQELTILCETDLALLMFSPSGQLTSFGSNGRVEDTFLRFLERPDEHKWGPIRNAEYLFLKLRELKNEAELLEKIATIEALEEKLEKINRQKDEVREKLRVYNPDVEKISSVAEAEMHQQVLISALEHIRLSKEELFDKQTVQQDTESKEDKLLGKQIVGQDMENFEQDKLLGKQIVQQETKSYEDKLLGKQIVRQDIGNNEDKLLGKQIVRQAASSYETAADDMKCPMSITEGSASTNKKRRGRPRKKPSSPMKTHLSMDFIRAQQDWNLQGSEHSSKMNKHIVRSLNKSIHF